MTLRWLPNALCIFRILLVAPIVAALLDREFLLALALIVVAGASDGLDGFLAKTFGWRTRLGSLLDPAADKLLLMSVFLSLTYLGLVPLAVTGTVVGRDLVIVLGALSYQFWIGPLSGEPLLISKVNTACQLAFVVFTVMQGALQWPARMAVVLLGAAVVFTSVTSGLAYVLEWSKRAWRVRHVGA